MTLRLLPIRGVPGRRVQAIFECVGRNPHAPKNPPGRVAHGTVLPGARPRTRAATSRSSGDDTRTPRWETDGPPQARRGASFLPPAACGVIDDGSTPTHTHLRED